MERLRNDFDVLVELTGRAMAALITIDPEQEWTMEEIAEMAIDQALAVQYVMKKRKNERKKETDSNVPTNPTSSASMSGICSRVHNQRIRGSMEG